MEKIGRETARKDFFPLDIGGVVLGGELERRVRDGSMASLK